MSSDRAPALRLALWLLLLAPWLALPALARAPAKPSVSATLIQKQTAWRKAMQATHAAAPGCYSAAYPSTQWRPMACQDPPPKDRVFQAGAPNYGQADNMVQAGGSVTGSAGTITSATGSIFDVFGLTSETVTGGPNNGTANVYSLQMNTNPFPTKTWCTAAQPSNCNGFQQFVFVNNDSDGKGGRKSYVFIEYVLQNYGNGCPSAAWMQSNGGCYMGSMETPVPVLPISGFNNLTLTGGIMNGNDFVTLALSAAEMYQYQAMGSFLGLSGWNQVQFNVFGDATPANASHGAQANFNPGATMQVTTTINPQPGLTVTCFKNSLTGETANLAAASACTVLGDAEYGIKFVEGVAPANVSISPTSGPAAGGTLINITGVGFTKSMLVSFGGVAGAPNCDSTTHCTATVPAGTGLIDVQVANIDPNYNTPGLYSAATPQDVFTYGPVLPAATLVPNSGSPLGGTPVTVEITNFVAASGAKINFNFPTLTAPALNVSCKPAIVSNTTTVCTMVTPPLNPAGAGPVATPVSLTSGTTTISLGPFTYVTPAPVTNPCTVCRQAGGLCTTKNGKFYCQCNRSSPTGQCQ